MWIWDAVGFLLVAFLLGSFAFWLVGYVLFEAVRHAVRGPSMQYRSLGTTVAPTMGETSRSEAIIQERDKRGGDEDRRVA